MKASFRSHPSVYMLLGALLVAAASALAAAGLQGESDPRIRFVDVEQVTWGVRSFQERRQRILEEARRHEEALQELFQEYRAKELTLENFKQGSSGHEQVRLELMLLETRLKFLKARGEDRINRQLLQLMNHTYDLVREAVREHVKQSNLAAVLMLSEVDPGSEAQIGLDQLNQRNAVRGVLFHDPRLDISEEILKRINAP